MEKTSFTPEQIRAIEDRGGSILVGAAAGSGKTTVMTERIVRLLCDPEHRTDASRLLVLTFSRAAAREMRRRIRAGLEKAVAENPGDPYLRSQQRQLSRSKIGTVHSFCASLLREWFSQADVAPDFSLVDEGMALALEERAEEETAVRCYEEFPDRMREISELFGQARSDREIFSCVRSLYAFERKIARPDRWKEKVLRGSQAERAADTPWGSYSFSVAMTGARDVRRMLRYALDTADWSVPAVAKNREVLEQDMEGNESLLRACEAQDWNGVIRALRSASNFKLSPVRSAPPSYADIKAAHSAAGQLRKDLLAFPFSVEEEEAFALEQKGAGALETLLELTDRFAARVRELKAERKILEYDDLEILAVELLYDGEEFSEAAKTISGNYDYIFVDEFQDTNERQKLIFDAVSGGKDNLFYVGDVKQSIYRFRNADCRIFTALRREYEQTGESFPEYLALHSNFRSAAPVIDAVNAVFSPLMSAEFGGVDYVKDREQLEKGGTSASCADGEAGLEFHLLAGGREDLPREVAAWIRQKLDSGYLVDGKEGPRPCREEDFCVLLGVAKNVADGYQKAMSDAGIRCSGGAAASFFDSSEIMTVMALLHVLDNPLRDVDLAAVLFSPLFGFSADELAQLKLETPRGSLWSRLCASREKKAADFVEKIRSMRNEIAVRSVGEAVEYAVTETGAELLLTAPPETALRRARLRAFLDYAASYTPLGSRDLGDFLRVCENAAAQDKGPVVSVSSEGGVTLTTIHKAKGLEWPIVILADATHQFNLRGDGSPFVMADDATGAGIKFRVDEGSNSYYVRTPSYAVAARRERNDSVSEELRVLYVALTRAKQLAAVFGSAGADTDAATLIGNAAECIIDGKPLTGELLKSLHFTRMLCTVYAAAGFSGAEERRGPLALYTEPTPAADAAEEETADAEEVLRLAGEIDRRVTFVYPDAALASVPTKISVTDLTEHREGALIQRPAFARGGDLSAAEKGTALHRFMQICDYEKAAADPQGEILRLQETGAMDERSAGAVDAARVRAFFGSELGRRARKTERVLREYPFMDTVPASALPGVPEGTGGTVLVQGIADCVLVQGETALLLDYKTDRVAEGAELIRRYSGQLNFYRRSLEKRLGLRITECCIWSFALNERVDVPLEEEMHG